MFKNLLVFSLLTFSATFSNNSNAQVIILASDVTNPPATSCTNTFYTVSGTLANSNYGYSGPVVGITGFNITITKDYFSGFAPMPGLTPFSEDIDFGMLPVGLYVVTTNSSVDGNLSSVDIGTFNVESCCTGSVDLGADSTICDTASLVLNVTTIGGSYNWQDGSTSPTFTVDTTGVYWVEMTESNGCVYTDSVTVEVVACDWGIEQISNTVSLTIYPNPAVSMFQIRGLKEDSKVSISSLTGGLVDFKRTNDSIDVSALDAGIYYVSVEFNGVVVTQRVVLQ